MRQHHMHSPEAASMYLARYRKPVCIVDKVYLCLQINKASGAPSGGCHPTHSLCQTSSAQEKHPSPPCPSKDLPTPALPEENSMEKTPDPPQCTVPLAHADTAQDSLLVGLALSQVFAHYVSTQAEAHDNQLGLRVGLLDVIHHGTEFPGAS